MPKFLKSDAVRLFESSIETYLLALAGYNAPRLISRKVGDTRYAPIMGLLGAAVELLAKACLVQASGISSLYREDGFYKYGSETLDDLRRLIKDDEACIAYLFEGVEDEDRTKAQLIELLDKFKLLQQYRANGLHAGIGTSRDIVAVVFTDVIETYDLLSECKRLKYLLTELPRIESPIIDRVAILDDLSRRIKASSELGTKANLLRALYLVLPKVPEIEPEWMERVERISIIPNEDDVSYLLKNMTDSHGIHLYKERGKDSDGLPVYVDPKNPNAIPILPFYLKRELTQISDQFHSDSSTANGRLTSRSYLSLPPDDFIIDLFALGIDSAGIYQEGKNTLTAQQVWPFVAGALDVQGTHRPYWFLINKCEDFDQLKSFLTRAVSMGGAYLSNNSKFAFDGLSCIIKDEIISDSKYLRTMLEFFSTCNTMHSKLLSLLKGEIENSYEIPSSFKDGFQAYLQSEITLGDLIVTFIAKSELEEDEKYWIRQALHAMYKYEDRKGLVAVYRDSRFESHKSEVRKLMRLADFLEYGPKYS